MGVNFLRMQSEASKRQHAAISTMRAIATDACQGNLQVAFRLAAAIVPAGIAFRKSIRAVAESQRNRRFALIEQFMKKMQMVCPACNSLDCPRAPLVSFDRVTTAELKEQLDL